ncbi:hypothetical protein ACHAXA_009288 [Cyclostephanos tholiformis]|uniref:PhoD-like phosphatase metallophosphatase domain-containing protein n=1 Tax=Cyclostephanos tholiformis TaxID=382380 RepID=A0ABD3REL7_9STRA
MNGDDGIKATIPHADAADIAYHNVDLRRIAFGSCHSRGAHDWRRRRTLSRTTSSNDDPTSSASSSSYPSPPAATTIWDVISSTVKPQTFLWTGDAVYPPREIGGDAPVSVLRDEYRRMLDDEDLGYARFLRGISANDDDGIITAHGTWDDHDYGGNDRGNEMTDKYGRRDAYLEFLNVSRKDHRSRYEREGVYSSMDYYRGVIDGGGGRGGGGGGIIRVIFLDTRWHREGHFIPSVASNPHVPCGSLISCATRWITACLDLPSFMPSWWNSWLSADGGGELLGENQWEWLGGQLRHSNASMHVIVSSIQVLTTNPVVESWGHFPRERARLLRLLNSVPGLIILSGDVHHAEISSTKTTRGGAMDDDDDAVASTNGAAIVEVTSSGLTHSCDEPFYGKLCTPILNAFRAHRASGGNARDVDSPSYYTGRNFGSIEIDWSTRTFRVCVRDASGDVVLSTVREMDAVANMSEEDMRNIPKCIDGHLWPFIRRVAAFHNAGIILGCLCLLIYRSVSRRRLTTSEIKKSKRD